MKAIILFLIFLAASAPPNDRETADLGGRFLVTEDSEQLRITNTSGYQLEPGVITPDEYMGLVRSLTEREQVGLGVETDIYRQAGSRIGCGVLFSGWLADWTEGEFRPLFVSGGLNYLFMAGTSPVLQVKASLFKVRQEDSGVVSTEVPPNLVYAQTQSWSLADAEYRRQYPANWPKQSFLYPDDNFDILAALTSNDPIVVSVNPHEDGLDLDLNLNLTPANKSGLGACLFELARERVDESMGQ